MKIISGRPRARCTLQFSNLLHLAKYEFTVQIAPHALKEYLNWEKHAGWSGHRIWEETKKGGRAIRRDKKTGKVTWVSPGLLFPLMGAMSEFASQDAHGRWLLAKPSRFKEEEMIQRTVNQFRAHNSDPMYMGRSEAALMEVLRDISEAGDQKRQAAAVN
jgi:hypothetical protein